MAISLWKMVKSPAVTTSSCVLEIVILNSSRFFMANIVKITLQGLYNYNIWHFTISMIIYHKYLQKSDTRHQNSPGAL